MKGTLSRILRRLAAPFRHRDADADLHDEIAAHLQLATDEHLQRGASPGEARRLAALAFGGVDGARERHRDARSLPALDIVRQDVVYALRGFKREPGFTLIAILILALGIGANTAVFSVVNPLLLRQLPFRDAERLVWIEDTRGTGLSNLTYQVGVFEEMQRHARSFERMTAYFAFFGYGSFKLTGGGDAERVSAVNIGPEFFEVLGVRPSAGRLFAQEEMAPNGPKAVILTHALWQRRFASDPSLVGRTITINDQAYNVVGLLPADFDFGSVFAPGVKVDLFLPAVFDEMRNWGNTLSVIGRLRPGVSLDAARAEFEGLIPRLIQLRPEWQYLDARLLSLKDHVSGRLTRSLIVLWCAVGLVILIVCANLSNLLLARTAARSKEFAVRMALGAGRLRLIRQLLTEGIVLALAGAALAALLAYGLTSMLRSSATLSLPLLARVGVDATALAFTAGLAIVTGVAFGLLPALRVSGRKPQEALKEQSRGSTDGRRHVWVRSALVVAEVALACVLLVGAGLLLRSFFALQQVELGFEPSRAVVARIDPSGTLSPEQRTALLEEVRRRVAAIPGVEAVGHTDALPLDRNRSWGLQAMGQEEKPSGESLDAFVYVVGPGYFDAMGIPLKAGRDFSNEDTSTRPRVLIVSETVARHLWPGEQAVGRLADSGGNPDKPFHVIGVVADVRQTSLEEGAAPQMYVVHTQRVAGGYDLVIRSTLPSTVLTSSVRATLATIDPTLVTSEFRPVQGLVERVMSPRRFLLTLLTGFSVLALVLACLGIYGVVSYGVSQRVHEIGLRMALGATGTDVCRLVLSSTVRLAGIGVGLGLVASFMLARLIATLLFETSPTDLATFGITAALLTLVALVAAVVPAIRAACISPLTALRTE
jgi:predicted permease